MKNSNVKKINGIGKACSIISLIAFIFCIVGFVCLIIADIAVLFFPTDKINLSGKANATVTLSGENMDFGVGNFKIIDQSNGLSLDSANDEITISDNKVDFGGVWSLDVEEIASDETSSTFNLTGDFEDFDQKALKRELFLKVIEAILTVIATAITLFFARRVFSALAKCDTPFTEEIVKKMKIFGWVMIGYAILCSLNLTIIVAGLAVLMLAYVFAHGTDLQKESDETL